MLCDGAQISFQEQRMLKLKRFNLEVQMEEFPATQRSCRLMTTEAKDLHLQLRSRGGVHFIFSFCRDGCVPGKLCFMLCVHGASVLEKRLMVIGSVRLFFFLKQCNELEMNLKSLVFNSRT
jgi:hypothetical protein